jgi:hypothetical protein
MRDLIDFIVGGFLTAWLIVSENLRRRRVKEDQ